MATYEVGQARVISDLMTLFTDALDFAAGRTELTDNAKLGIFPADMREALRGAQSTPADFLPLLADHIAGMTDGYAIRLHAGLMGVGIVSFNEFV